MFEELQAINRRPQPFSVYTADKLWTDPHTAREMLNFHLHPDLPVASRTRSNIERSVAWMQHRFDIGPGKSVADFGCGPGLYTTRFARTDAQVTGVDFSANSIRHAREIAAREGLRIEYLEQNYLDFESDRRFDLICMIMYDFCALGPNQRKQLLGIVGDHLMEKGSFLLDVFSLAGFELVEERSEYGFRLMDGFWSAEDYYGFLNTFKYEEAKVTLDKYSLFEARHSWTIFNWLQYYSPETLAGELAECGLDVVETYADLAGAPYGGEATEFAVVVRKRT